MATYSYTVPSSFSFILHWIRNHFGRNVLIIDFIRKSQCNYLNTRIIYIYIDFKYYNRTFELYYARSNIYAVIVIIYTLLYLIQTPAATPLSKMQPYLSNSWFVNLGDHKHNNTFTIKYRLFSRYLFVGIYI